jgi:hypothetical protein
MSLASAAAEKISLKKEHLSTWHRAKVVPTPLATVNPAGGDVQSRRVSGKTADKLYAR